MECFRELGDENSSNHCRFVQLAILYYHITWRAAMEYTGLSVDTDKVIFYSDALRVNDNTY